MEKSKYHFAIVYIYIKDETYTEDFKKIVMLMKKVMIESTIIIRKRDDVGNSVDILVDKTFLRLS